MQTTIWKYILKEGKNKLEIPCPAEILSADSQHDDIVIYALVSLYETFKEKIEFRVFGTGHTINISTLDWKFLNTVKLCGGMFMYHIYYKKIKEVE